MSLVYAISCDPTISNDVVERRLTVKVNGEIRDELSYDPTTKDMGEQVFLDGDNVTLTLVDVDDVGNISDPAIIEFIAADTIHPEKPGFNITLIREE